MTEIRGIAIGFIIFFTMFYYYTDDSNKENPLPRKWKTKNHNIVWYSFAFPFVTLVMASYNPYFNFESMKTFMYVSMAGMVFNALRDKHAEMIGKKKTSDIGNWVLFFLIEFNVGIVLLCVFKLHAFW